MTTFILEQNPDSLGLPYFSDEVALPDSNQELRVTVKGTISSDPLEFAVNIIQDGNKLCHVNPRWTEERTVFNCYSNQTGWFQEEYAFYPSLLPESEFTVIVTQKGNHFSVLVNNEPVKDFFGAIPCRAKPVKVSVEKGNCDGHEDLVLRHVQLEFINSSEQNEPTSSELSDSFESPPGSSSITCPVCYNKCNINYALRCGHVLCADCLPRVRNCPQCRGTLEGNVRLFIAN